MEAPSSHIYFSQRLRLHYVAWGNPDAPPLLLIHGGSDHSRSWDWVAKDLRGDYRVLAPDLRGHGDSQWAPGGGCYLVDFVYNIVQLVRQTQLTGLTTIAHSLGGSIALLYAALFPDTVRKLVIIEGLAHRRRWSRSGSTFRSPGDRPDQCLGTGADRTMAQHCLPNVAGQRDGVVGTGP